MQNAPNLDELLQLNSIVLHRNFKAVQFPDKLKTLRNARFKIINKHTEVTLELLPQDGKTFHTHKKLLIPYFSKETLLFPQIESYKEQNIEKDQDSETSHMIQNDLFTSCHSFEFDDNVFHDEPFCNTDDDQSIMLDNES